jgi:hypothetical protein
MSERRQGLIPWRSFGRAIWRITKALIIVYLVLTLISAIILIWALLSGNVDRPKDDPIPTKQARMWGRLSAVWPAFAPPQQS